MTEKDTRQGAEDLLRRLGGLTTIVELGILGVRPQNLLRFHGETLVLSRVARDAEIVRGDVTDSASIADAPASRSPLR